MAKYTLPKKFETELEIEGLGKITLTSSFVEKMDFITWLEANKNQKPVWLITETLETTLPENWATAILDSGDLSFITQIYNEIVANKLGMSLEAYLVSTNEKKE